METLYYLLKSAGILSLFYLVYTLLLKKETLFNINRRFLLFGILAAVLLPFLQFTKTVILESPVLGSLPTSAFALNGLNAQNSNPFYSVENILIIIYATGLLVLLSRFIYQLFTLFLLLKKHPTTKRNGYKLIEVSEAISPFSFFNYVVFNPLLHTEKELGMILAHEKVHIRQYHSVDVLISNLLIIVQWFNPLAWAYKKSIEENLEFIADRNTAEQVASKKEYQLALVKATSVLLQPALTNYFYKSFIKKRIIMLNKTNSKKRNALKATIILPLLAIFLWSFNVNEVTKYVEIQQEKTKTETSIIEKGVSNSISEEKLVTSDATEPLRTKASKNNNIPTIVKKTSTQDRFRVKIDKSTTYARLQEIKEELKDKYSVELSYAAIRNKSNEITSLTLSYNGNGNNGNYQLSQDQGIDEFFFFVDDDGKTGFWSEAAEKRHKESLDKRIMIMDKRDLKLEERNDKMKEHHKERKMMMEERRTEMIERRNEINANYPNASSSDTKEDRNFPNSKKYIKNADDPLYYIDGEETSKKELEQLLPDNIEKVNVLKGEKALKKYGGKGVNGVIEITTKKQ